MGETGLGQMGTYYSTFAVFMKIQIYSKIKSILKKSRHFQKGYIPEELDLGKKPKDF